MQEGRFPVELIGGVPVVAAPGEIDLTSAPALRSALLEAVAHGRGTIVVDMSRTSFCDCSGLHALLAARTCARAEGGELLLAIGGTSVLRVFELTGTDRVIPRFMSVDEALTHASAGRSGGHRRADGAAEGGEDRGTGRLDGKAC